MSIRLRYLWERLEARVQGIRLTAVIAVFCLAIARAASADIIYNLGTLGGTGSFGYGINDSGQVTGHSWMSGVSEHAFLYTGTPGSGGAMADLGTLGGPYSWGRAINYSGQVAGWSYTSGSSYHAFRYTGTPGSGGSMVSLGTLGGTWSEGHAINDSGQVAGYSDTSSGATRAFLYTGTPGSGGVMHDLGTLGGSQSFGHAINASAQVAGWSNTGGNGAQRAFRYDGTPGAGGIMRELGTLSGSQTSQGHAINGSGQVAGWSNTGDGTRAFRYDGTPGSGGVMHDLGTLGGTQSFGHAINTSGQVAGTSNTTGFGNSRAFLYTGTPGSGGQMIDLDAWLDSVNPTEGAKWTLTEALGLNDVGQVTGAGTYDPDGPGGVAAAPRAYLLNIPLNAPPPAERPIYDDIPTRTPGANGLIVVAHGWLSSPSHWPINLAERIDARLTELDTRGEWDIVAYDWQLSALTLTPFHAGNNAIQHGRWVGTVIADEGYDRVHFVGHSAGSWLIESASRYLDADVTIHSTFLDAFAPFLTQFQLGAGADWAEHYFASDIAPWTQEILPNAYNLEVTGLHPSGDADHSWPHEWYRQTVDPSDDATGWGFRRSMEEGTLPSHDDYPRGEYDDLGNGLGGFDLRETTRLAALDFTAAPILRSQTGTVTVDGTAITLTTGSPVWMTTVVQTELPIIFIELELEFISVDAAEGLLALYWDGEIVGTVDERLAIDGLEVYGFMLSEESLAGAHLLSLRLDSFTEFESSVHIASLNFVSVPEPACMAIVGMALTLLLRRRVRTAPLTSRHG